MFLSLLAAAAQSLTAPVPAEPASPAPPAAVVMTFDRTGAESTRIVRGLADRATGRRLTADDPVRIASISKLVVALGVMRLVEQRRLDLNADVSTYLGWRLRAPGYPDRPITLAMLLGHRSGLTDGIDYALPLDGDLEMALARPEAWDSARAPGGAFHYANINFPVIAAVMEGATGERFDLLMQRLVLRPLAIDACFNWVTCSDTAVARAVTLYRPDGSVARDGLGGQRPACPVLPARDGGCDLATYRLARNGSSFSPQGGLRISARGLARIGEMLLRGGDRFLTRRSLDRLMRLQAVEPQGAEQGFFCRYGLAMHAIGPARRGRVPAGCRDDVIGDGVERIGHSGEAYSLRSGLFIDTLGNEGLVWFVTQVPETPPLGDRSAFTAAEEQLLDEARVRHVPTPRR